MRKGLDTLTWTISISSLAIAISTLSVSIDGCKPLYRTQSTSFQRQEPTQQQQTRYDDSWRGLPPEIQNHPKRDEYLPYVKK